MGLIRKPHELESVTSIKVLIYGQPGIGKTTLALSSPQPLLVDFDGGVHRIRPEHQSDTVQVKSWQDMADIMGEDLSAYRTLVIDTAGKMLDYMSAHIIKGDPKMGRKDGQLALQGFGVRKGMFQRFLGQASTLGKHLVFVAHDREERDGDNKIIRPEIGGSSAGDLIKELDLVGYMEAQGKNRTISFDPCEKFYGKNTCGLDSLITLPDLNKQRNLFLSSVFDQFAKSVEARKNLAVQYVALMDVVQANIAGITDADTAQDFVEWIGGTEHIWDSKLQAGHLLKERMSAIGLHWNKATKRYEALANAA